MQRVMVTLLVALSLMAAACGDDGSEGSSGAPADPAASPAAGDGPTDPALVLPSDYEQVCGGGTVSLAAPYDTGPGIHPLLVFEGQDPEYEYRSMTLPEGWQSDSISVADTQLVACLDRIKEKKAMTCEDYESDDFPEPFDVEVYNATWAATLYEANTGEEIATGELVATAKDCPMIVFFDESEEVQREYADPDDQLRGFVKQYVAP
ncbi:MAG TPA: hypothetical protein VJ927_11960 [Actinomycetota bacterium]|nr:hypothetical protein [Actinomycetota bacterium]